VKEVLSSRVVVIDKEVEVEVEVKVEVEVTQEWSTNPKATNLMRGLVSRCTKLSSLVFLETNRGD